MGKHNPGAVTNTLPSYQHVYGQSNISLSTWNSSADPYITNITVTNPNGGINDGLDGDVAVGYFKPLAAEFTNPGHEEDIYFMVLNGLSDSTVTPAQTQQNIRLYFDFTGTTITSLERLDRDTGSVVPVSLTPVTGSQYYLDLTLDGGTGDLLKFNNGGTFVGF